MKQHCTTAVHVCIHLKSFLCVNTYYTALLYSRPNVGCCVKHENVLKNCKKFKSTIKFTINPKQLLNLSTVPELETMTVIHPSNTKLRPQMKQARAAN